MQKTFEQFGVQREPATPSAPVQADQVGLDKVAEARALLNRIEERKKAETAELNRRLQQEVDNLNIALLGKPKGGYCGC